MLPQLIRWTVLLGLWKKFRKQILLTLLCIGLLVLLSILHQDFVAYQATLTEPNQTWLAWSFAVKWGLYFVVLLVYWWMISRSSSTATSDLHQEMADLEQVKAQMSKADGGTNKKAKEQDPFATIRTKSKLRSKAEIIIEHGKNKP